jgi:plasmid stabilization system protein ParE
MKRKIAFQLVARAEMQDASKWYEAKRSGLAAKFLEEIERCLSLAASNPIQFPLQTLDIRRITTRQFPYNIYFRPEAQRIVVVAVFHVNRDPQIWLNRL